MSSEIPPPFPPAPSPYGYIYPPPPRPAVRKTRYWIPIVLFLLLAFVVLFVVVGHSVYVGSQSANIAIEQLHRTMVEQDWETLYSQADEQYRAAMTSEASRALFEGIAHKLGTPGATKQIGTQVQTTLTGKYLIGSFQTEFSLNAKATERVTWHQSNGSYRLVGYNIQSNELISR